MGGRIRALELTTKMTRLGSASGTSVSFCVLRGGGHRSIGKGGGRGRIDENGRQLRRKLSVGLMVVVGRRKLSLSSTHAPTHPPTHAPAVEEEDLARAAQRRDELVHDPAGDVGELVLRALAPQRLGRGARGRAWQPPMLVCCDSGGGGEMVVVGRWRGRAG